MQTRELRTAAADEGFAITTVQRLPNILWNAETDHKSVRHTPKPGSWGADHDFMQVHVKYLISIVRLWAFSRGCAGAHSHALPDDDLREH